MRILLNLIYERNQLIARSFFHCDSLTVEVGAVFFQSQLFGLLINSSQQIDSSSYNRCADNFVSSGA